MKKILLVEDQPDIQEILADFLRNNGYVVNCSSDGRQAENFFQKADYQLVITDLIMPKTNGFELIKTIRKKNSVPILVITGGVTSKAATEEYNILENNNFPILRKPFAKKDLLSAVEDQIGKAL